ncbi:hypothetical protein KC717_03680 [Candidatus Dojkabacteria bacterium]|uniref:Uncharacterized protein n=1 Tax=Candidatus Dojkabacteria bacterium TaxID=2099670 RepID=A0A955RKR4_9BACT|nr:hypothetical protein [Candidatus Dojkabacteria bacterium]
MSQLSLLENSKKILIVTPDLLSYDSICSAVVLSKLLTRQGKEVQILTNKEEYERKFSEDIKVDQGIITDKVLSKNFKASLPSNREIDTIEVVEENNAFNIVIKTKSGRLIHEQIAFERSESEFDLVITLGLLTPESSQEYMKSFSSSINAEKTLNIHYSKSTINADSHVSLKTYTLSEIIKHIAEELSLALTNEDATYLLAGLLSNTHSLKVNTTKKTILNLYELVYTHNGNVRHANSFIHRSINKEQSIWFKEVFNDIQKEDFFVHSHVNNELVDGDLISRLTLEDKSPLMRISNCKVSLVTVRLNNRTYGILQTQPGTISTLDLTKDYTVVGDKVFVQFWTNQTPKEVVASIRSSLSLTSRTEQNQQEEPKKERREEMEEPRKVVSSLLEEEIKAKSNEKEFIPKLSPEAEAALERNNVRNVTEEEKMTIPPQTITNKNEDSAIDPTPPAAPFAFEPQFTPSNYNPLPAVEEDEEFSLEAK